MLLTKTNNPKILSILDFIDRFSNKVPRDYKHPNFIDGDRWEQIVLYGSDGSNFNSILNNMVSKLTKSEKAVLYKELKDRANGFRLNLDPFEDTNYYPKGWDSGYVNSEFEFSSQANHNWLDPNSLKRFDKDKYPNYDFKVVGGKAYTKDDPIFDQEERFKSYDVDDFHERIYERGYAIDTATGTVYPQSGEKAKLLRRKFGVESKEDILEKEKQYKDLISKQEEELTKQYATAQTKTDWIKITIYIIIAIIVAYIIYRIVKWLYRWYKKRKAQKANKLESYCYNYNRLLNLCEADETHQIGAIYNSYMNRVISFFKKVFGSIEFIMKHIYNLVSLGSAKLYQKFTSMFNKHKPIEELKKDYTDVCNNIKQYSSSVYLKDKLDGIANILPKV